MGVADAALSGGNPEEQLLHSVKRGDREAVESLLSQSPGLIREKAADGASAILLAIYHGHPEMVELFQRHGAELDFFEACAAGDRARALHLLEADRDLLNRRSGDGYPALALAVFFGHEQLAEDLLERGADVNAAASNPQKVAPLHAAVARRNLRLIRLLLSRGANAGAAQAAGFTPIHGAAFHGDLEAIDTLLSHGADPNAQTADGRTAADLAAERGHQEAAELLSQKKQRGSSGR